MGKGAGVEGLVSAAFEQHMNSLFETIVHRE